MELPITKNTNNTREDYKAEEDIENMDEINPNLLKILEKNFFFDHLYRLRRFFWPYFSDLQYCLFHCSVP